MRSKMQHIVVIVIAFIAIAVFAYAEPNTATTGKSLSVDELATNPTAHIGRVAVVGVVGIVNPDKGFVLVDSKEFKDCSLSCLSDPGTKKIPFIWTGTAPKVMQTVLVDAVLEKTAKGFSITAEKVTKQ